MRPIEFRGKRKDNGEWVYGYYEQFRGIDYIRDSEGFIHEVTRESVGQFTGLYDSTKWEELTEKEQKAWLATGKTKEEWKGKEIYEGDIVNFQGTERDKATAKVEFYEGRYIFRLTETIYKDIMGWKNTTVIGNIHDNPELLEEKK